MNITETIDSVAFKHALFEGKVEFDYVKKDGTLRHAVGTMNEALLPKSDPIVAKFKVTDIVWAQSKDAPKTKRCTICLTQHDIDKWGEDAMDDVVRDAIELKFQFAVEEFCYWPVDMAYESERKMPEDSVFYFDIDKQAYRSFKLAQLKGWKSC